MYLWPICSVDFWKLPLQAILESLSKVVGFIIDVTGPIQLIIWAPWPWGSLIPNKNIPLLLSFLPPHHYRHHFQSWHWKQYWIVFAILEWHCSVISVFSVIISSKELNISPKLKHHQQSAFCIYVRYLQKCPFKVTVYSKQWGRGIW